MAKYSNSISAVFVVTVAAIVIGLSGCGGTSGSTAPQPPQVTTQFLPGGVSGNSYGVTLAATGGLPPYSWSISSGSLPQGLSLNPATGEISGTLAGPPGTSDFSAKVTDSDMPPLSGSAPLSISVIAPGSSPITHVVIIFQENRSTDNLFQDPVLIRNGADIQNFGIDSTGAKVPLTEGHLATDFDLGHSHSAFNVMCDLQTNGQCKMDGADKISVDCNPGATDCPAPHINFAYVDPSDVQPYFQLAEQYTFGDRMFQTNEGPSFPAHQFIISGTSWPGAPYSTNLFASSNPDGQTNPGSAQPNAGCDAVSDALVSLIGPAGVENPGISPIYPCFDHTTLTDLLEAQGLSWKYYTPSITDQYDQTYSSPAIWNGPEAIEHICGPNQPPPNATHCVGNDWNEHVVLNQEQVLTDIAAGQLSTVSWVIPSGQDSDHPGNVDGNTGPSWVASVVNAIGTSPYWQNTAIFITWDDWGGWYDHVPPPQVLVNCSQWGCGYVYGFRVPLIVVSAFAKTGYISHTQHDFGSILKFIEETFGLPSLNYADAYADDLSDCFDFTQDTRAFKTIHAPVNADFFLHDTRQPLPPDND